MRAAVMLVMHQLSSHGFDPAFIEVFWMLAGSVGAVMVISLVWRVLRMALFFLSWAVLFAAALVIFGHLALRFL